MWTAFAGTARPARIRRTLPPAALWGDRLRRRYFNGSLDEVQIFSRALSSNEVPRCTVALTIRPGGADKPAGGAGTRKCS